MQTERKQIRYFICLLLYLTFSYKKYIKSKTAPTKMTAAVGLVRIPKQTDMTIKKIFFQFKPFFRAKTPPSVKS